MFSVFFYRSNRTIVDEVPFPEVFALYLKSFRKKFEISVLLIKINVRM
jgi:hypothetical protein